MIFIVVFNIFYFLIFSEYHFNHSTVSNNCNLRTSMAQYICLIGESIQNLREYVFIAMSLFVNTIHITQSNFIVNQYIFVNTYTILFNLC